MRSAILLVFMLSFFSASATAADDPAQQPAPASLSQSKANNCAAIFYPPAAIAAGEEGPVTLAVQIDDAGNVTAASVTQSSGFADLDQAAVKCVTSGWHFHPATLDGKPVASTKAYRIVWHLTGDQGDYPCSEIPNSEKAAFIGKSVFVAYRVDTSGHIQDPFVISSSNDSTFDARALQCLSHVSYEAPPAPKSWGGRFSGTQSGVLFSNGQGAGITCEGTSFPPDVLNRATDQAVLISFESTENAPPSDLMLEQSSGNQQFDDAATACVKAWRYTFPHPGMLISVDAKIVSHQGQVFVLIR